MPARGYEFYLLSVQLDFKEGGVTVSNNFTKRRKIGFKIGTRDKFATHLRLENFISNEIVIYTIFLRSVIFLYNSLYTQAVAYTTYFELEEPAVSHDWFWFSFWLDEKVKRVL